MNLDITKSKNAISANSLEARLARLEGIFQQLLQVADNKQQNILPKDGLEAGLLARIAAMPANRSQQTPIMTTVSGGISGKKSSKNNLLLSQAQMVAELAAAILRANQRNL